MVINREKSKEIREQFQCDYGECYQNIAKIILFLAKNKIIFDITIELGYRYESTSNTLYRHIWIRDADRKILDPTVIGGINFLIDHFAKGSDYNVFKSFSILEYGDAIQKDNIVLEKYFKNEEAKLLKEVLSNTSYLMCKDEYKKLNGYLSLDKNKLFDYESHKRNHDTIFGD